MAWLVGDILKQMTSCGPELDRDTVDRLEIGDLSTEVRGIVVAFMASQETIDRAAALGANLLITHEGLFYSHRDKEDLIGCDPVVLQKRKRLRELGIAVFRCHDGIHHDKPDGITAGLIEELGWKAHVREYRLASAVLELPPMTLSEIALLLKHKLALPFVRIVGGPATVCRTAGVLVGYRGGGELAIPLLGAEDVDVIITGEGPEWETPEYVRDAVYQGRGKALIVLGHGPSEAPGMKRLASSLQAVCPDVPVYFIAERPLFQWM